MKGSIIGFPESSPELLPVLGKCSGTEKMRIPVVMQNTILGARNFVNTQGALDKVKGKQVN